MCIMLFDDVTCGLLIDSVMIVMLLSLICQMYMSGLFTGFDVKSHLLCILAVI